MTGATIGVVTFAMLCVASAFWVDAIGQPTAPLALAVALVLGAALVTIAAHRPLAGFAAGVVMLALAIAGFATAHGGEFSPAFVGPAWRFARHGGQSGMVLGVIGAVLGASLTAARRGGRAGTTLDSTP